MKFQNLLLVLILSIAVSWATVSLHKGESASAVVKETRWEQVKRTGILRCGYSTWPPFIEKDLKTGTMKGAIPEIVEEMAKKLQLKVDWSVEVEWGSMFSAYNRVDIICSPVVRNGARGRETDNSIPLGYVPLYMYVRSDDTRFDNHPEAFNSPNVKLSVTDGDYSQIIASELFPKAQQVALPQIAASGAQLIMQVATRKADAVATEPFSLDSYMAANPGKIKQVAGPPIRTLNFGLPLPPNEPAFKSMIDSALTELHETGFIDRTFARYETGQARVLRIAQPYALPSK